MQIRPRWASSSDSLAKNLHDPSSSRLPQLHRNKFILHPKYGKTSMEEDEWLPDPVSPTEVPIPFVALVSSINTPDKLAQYNAVKVQDQLPSAPTPSRTSYNPFVADSPAMPTDVVSAKAEDVPARHQSMVDYGSAEWYERTSTHILGSILLLLTAIIIVEVGQKMCKVFRIERRPYRGRLRLKGEEQRLAAYRIALDEEKGRLED